MQLRSAAFSLSLLAGVAGAFACSGSESGGDAAPTSLGGAGTNLGTGGGGPGGTGGLQGGAAGTDVGAGGTGAGVGGKGTGESVLPTYAVSKLFQGSGGQDLSWTDVAINVDGLSFPDQTSPGHCQLVNGASPGKSLVDGPDGRDNSYSRNIMPIILTFAKTAPQDANDNIQKGEFTILTRFAQFGGGADQQNLGVQFFPARGPKDSEGKIMGPGADWTLYPWETVPESVTGSTEAVGDDIQSLSQVANGVLLGNVWSSGDPTIITLVVSLQGISLPLRIRKALVTATFADDHSGATKGMLTGALATAEMVTAIKTVAGKLSPSLCSGGIIDSILTSVKRSSDMMADGSQDPNKVCDGISIGLGFESTKSKMGKVAPVEPLLDPCME